MSRYMVRKLEQNFIWSSHILRPIVKDIKGIMAFGQSLTNVLLKKIVPSNKMEVVYNTALNIIKLSYELASKFNYDYFNINGCHFNSINILCYNILILSGNFKYIKKIGFILSNCFLVDILDLSWELIQSLKNEIKILFSKYKDIIFNFFNCVINRLYPSTIGKNIFLGNMKFFIWHFFIVLKHARYVFKKQIVLYLEQHINDMNNRFRSLIIINLLKVLKWNYLVV